MAQIREQSYEVCCFAGKDNQIQAGGVLSEVVVNIRVDQTYTVTFQ